jgi:hypothetical protein
LRLRERRRRKRAGRGPGTGFPQKVSTPHAHRHLLRIFHAAQDFAVEETQDPGSAKQERGRAGGSFERT